jgi:hypothetical protein
VTSDTSDTSGKHVTPNIHNPETHQMLTRSLRGLRKTGRIPCRSMYFTCNLPTTPWMREHFHSRKYLGIMLCKSLWGRYPGRKSFYFIMFVFVRLYSLLVHLVVGVQEAFRVANSYHFIEFILFSQLPLYNYILSHSSYIANDTNHAMRRSCSHMHIWSLRNRS